MVRKQSIGWTAAALAAALLLVSNAAVAAPSEEQIARLGGPEFTPVGAERAGNADGTIPAWKGGITEGPPGWKPGMKRPDSFADDPVLFSIDAGNVEHGLQQSDQQEWSEPQSAG